ncbi:MAG: sulfotransferase domain-containing protein [Sphingomonas sp.]
MSGIRWLVSYPRSGNTWTRLALWTIRHGEPAALDRLGEFGQMALSRKRMDMVLDCDTGLMTADEVEVIRPHFHRALAPTEPLVKVHDSWRVNRNGRPVHGADVTHSALYLIRDPRDVAVSWARFRHRSIDWAIDFLADAGSAVSGSTAKLFTQTPQHVGSWSGHATSWIDRSGLHPLVVRYEDLVADTRGWLTAMAERLAWPASDVVIDMAVEATRFDRLARLERETGFPEHPRGTHAFFRQGQARGWQGALTPAQVARIERDHGAVMERFAYL